MRFRSTTRFSWFVPNRGGNHELKFGMQYQFTTADSTNQGTLNGYFTFRGNEPFDARNPATYPERLQMRVPGPSDFYMKAHFASGIRTGQMAAQRPPDAEPRAAVRPRMVPLREENNPAFADPEDIRSTRTTSHRVWGSPTVGRGQSVGRCVADTGSFTIRRTSS